MLHVWNIYLYIYHEFMPNVGINFPVPWSIWGILDVFSCCFFNGLYHLFFQRIGIVPWQIIIKLYHFGGIFFCTFSFRININKFKTWSYGVHNETGVHLRPKSKHLFFFYSYWSPFGRLHEVVNKLPFLSLHVEGGKFNCIYIFLLCPEIRPVVSA